MSFTDELMADADVLDAEAENVFHAVVDAVFDSIVNGSPITGAPGQPVAAVHRPGTVVLKTSWTKRYANPRLAFIESSDPKAIYIEIDARGIEFATGGPHSLKLTEMRFQNLIDASTGRWDSLAIGP